MEKSYRLVTKVAYNTWVVLIKWIGTHAEYSKKEFSLRLNICLSHADPRVLRPATGYGSSAAGGPDRLQEEHLLYKYFSNEHVLFDFSPKCI
ncbi:MAG: type II toxin-antitoxin system HigB family toxin [Spirochaetia bacterium]